MKKSVAGGKSTTNRRLRMCCCDSPNVNGTPGYKWQPRDEPRIRPIDPPHLRDGDVLLFDEPGRCGGLDGHSYHFRLVKFAHDSNLSLLVRHGGGDECITLGCVANVAAKHGTFDSLT